MHSLKLSQLSELTGIKRHTLNARLKTVFNDSELERTSSNQIILTPYHANKLINNITQKKMGNILYVGNLKGGVGKTTISYILASTLSSLGFKTCAVDLDVQANLTNQFFDKNPSHVFYDVIDNKSKIEEVIIPISDYLHILPSSLKNSLIQKALTMQAPKHHLSWFNTIALNYLRSNYNYIVVDTPPSLTTLNSVFCLCLNEPDTIIVPVCPEEFSILGVEMFLNDVNEIRTSYQVNQEVNISILMNRFFQTKKNNLEVLVKMSNLYGEYLSDIVIKDNAKMSEIINKRIQIGDIKRAKDIYQTIQQLMFSLGVFNIGENHAA